MRKRIQAAVVPAVIVAAVVQDERFNQVWAGGAGSSHWAAEQHQPDARCVSGPGQGRDVSHVHQWSPPRPAGGAGFNSKRR
jgi:hypothetical protein